MENKEITIADLNLLKDIVDLASTALLARLYGPLTALSNVRIDVMTSPPLNSTVSMEIE